MIMKEKTVKMSQIALFSSVATLLMFFEFPILFLPQFYKMDFSEVVTLISGFMLGPISGVIVELLKNILKILFKGTSTAGVGELSNFLIGCSFVLPSSIFYKRNRTKKKCSYFFIDRDGVYDYFFDFYKLDYHVTAVLEGIIS